MAQKDLIPLNKRTKEEQKRIAIKGGKASGRARQHNKTVREVMKKAIWLPVDSKKDQKKLEKAGLPPVFGGLMIYNMMKNAGKSAQMGRLVMELLEEIGQSNIIINNTNSGMSGLVESLTKAREQRQQDD